MLTEEQFNKVTKEIADEIIREGGEKATVRFYKFPQKKNDEDERWRQLDFSEAYGVKLINFNGQQGDIESENCLEKYVGNTSEVILMTVSESGYHVKNYLVVYKDLHYDRVVLSSNITEVIEARDETKALMNLSYKHSEGKYMNYDDFMLLVHCMYLRLIPEDFNVRAEKVADNRSSKYTRMYNYTWIRRDNLYN